MNNRKKMRFGFILALFIIMSCTPPGSETDTDPTVIITDIQHKEGRIALIIALEEGIIATAAAHTQSDFSDQGISKEGIADGSPLALSIEGLTPGEPYYIKVTGKNTQGDEKSAEPPDNPYAAVPAFTLASRHPGGISLTFTAPPGLTIRAQASPFENFDAPITQEVTSTGSEQNLIFENLSQGVSYYVRVRTEKDSHTSRWINAESNPHAPGTTTVSITEAVKIKDGALTLTASTLAGFTLMVSAYTASDFTDTPLKVEETATGDSQEITIDGLVNDTPYYLQIQAKENGAAIDYPVDVPGNPHTPLDHSVAISSISSTTSGIAVAAASVSAGVTIEVEVSEENTFTSVAAAAEELRTDTPQALFTEGLTPGKAYYVRARGVTADDEGAWTTAGSSPYTFVVPQVMDLIPQDGRVITIFTAALDDALILELSTSRDFETIAYSQSDTGGGDGGQVVYFNEVTNDRSYYFRVKVDIANEYVSYSTPVIPTAAGKQYIHRLSELAKINNDSDYPGNWDYELKSHLSFGDANNDGVKNDPFDANGAAEGNWTMLTDNNIPSSNPLSGTIDGGGFAIDGAILKGGNYSLFGILKRGEIRNLGVTNFVISDLSTKDIGAGGLLLFAKDSSTIVNSYATGQIDGRNIEGGLVGYLEDSSIENSYTDVLLEEKVLSYIKGGLVGLAKNGDIKNSYAIGDILGKGAELGGLVGRLTEGSTVKNCYALGNVITSHAVVGFGVGGLVGTNTASTISNSFAFGNVSHMNSSNDTGGLVGDKDTGLLENSYRYEGQIVTNGTNTLGIPVSLTELQTAQWYLQTPGSSFNGLSWQNENQWHISGPLSGSTKNFPRVYEQYQDGVPAKEVPGQSDIPIEVPPSF